MKRAFPLLISLTLSLLTDVALATPLQPQDDILLRLDKNADGQISIKEAVADPFILESFSRIDINGDGIISRHELSSVQLRRSHGHSLN